MPRLRNLAALSVALAAPLATASPIAVTARDSHIHSVSAPADIPKYLNPANIPDNLNLDLTERGRLIVEPENEPDDANPEKFQEYISSLSPEILRRLGLHYVDDKKKVAARDVQSASVSLPADSKPTDNSNPNLPGDNIKTLTVSDALPLVKEEQGEIWKKLIAEKFFKDMHDDKEIHSENLLKFIPGEVDKELGLKVDEENKVAAALKKEEKRKELITAKGEIDSDVARQVIQGMFPNQAEIWDHLSLEETVNMANEYLRRMKNTLPLPQGRHLQRRKRSASCP